LQTQMSQGLSRVEAELEDLVLDSPKAVEVFGRIKQRALKQGWVQLGE
jgi:hypothetical protein